MRSWHALAAAAALILSWSPAGAADVAPGAPAGLPAIDPRVRVIDYAPDTIVPLDTTPGFAVTIDFGDEEKIETVSIGDSSEWQISPNRRANLLFVKPMAAPLATNMTVVTSMRVYYFALTASARRRAGHTGPTHTGPIHSGPIHSGPMHTGPMHSGPLQSGAAPAGQIFALHFAHAAPATVAALADPVPADAPAAAPSATQPHVANAAYSYEGSREALPLRVFDDGTSTWFRFAETMDLPAIFAREPDGSLAVANIANRDGYVVIDRIAASFELRRGKAVTRVFNDAFRPEAAAGSQLPLHDTRHRRAKSPPIAAVNPEVKP